MKTSKIIFVSLLGVIALVILGGFVAARFTGKRNVAGIVNKQIIPSFKVIYIKNCDVSLSYGDSSFISVTGKKDFPFSEINYKLTNDTLRISDIRFSQDSNKRVIIYSTDSLNTIEVVNSDLTIDKFGSKKLRLSSENSFVRFNRNLKDEVAFNSLSIIAKKHSTIDSDDFKTNNLNIFLEKSEADLNITALRISGTLSDSSSISIKQADDISIKKDSTCRISINN